MKQSRYALFAALLLMGLVSGCGRSRYEVWEDTKTCGRYMNKGLRSLMGRHTDSREYVAYADGWDEPTQRRSLSQDFEPLGGTDKYAQLSLQEYAPPSRESPGDPGSPIPGIEGFSAPSGKLAELFANIHFDTDHYAIKGSENVAVLQEIAQYLKGHPNLYIFVEGHSDERGAAAYNLALGARRAHAVRTFLVQNGVNPDQLFTISYGLERPLSLEHEEIAWKQNRRAQFKIFDYQTTASR